MKYELSPREREVLQFILKGHPNKVIAHLLSISECTVKIHVRNLLFKTRSLNRTQLAIRELTSSPPENLNERPA